MIQYDISDDIVLHIVYDIMWYIVVYDVCVMQRFLEITANYYRVGVNTN